MTASLFVSLVAVSISALSAYFSHFRKKTLLFVNAYTDLMQDDAYLSIIFTNGGNISLVISRFQVGATNNTAGSFSTPSFKPFPKSSPHIEARQNRVIKPGEHLELLVHAGARLQGTDYVLEFETITGQGFRLYHQEKLASSIGLALTPSLIPVQIPTGILSNDFVATRVWKRVVIDGYERGAIPSIKTRFASLIQANLRLRK